MRRDELIEAARNLLGALKASNMTQTVLSATRPNTRDGVASGLLFAAYANFMTNYSSFGENEKTLMKLFHIEPITSTSLWEKLVKPEGNVAIQVRRGLTFLEEFLPTVISMLERESDRNNATFEDPSDPSRLVESERIRFFVRDPGLPTLTLQHFAGILRSIGELHSSIETVEQYKHTELIVASLDSGSDKEFDLLGIASSVKKLSETLLEVWNRIQAAKATKAKVNYASACEGIAVLVKLNAAEKSNAIPREQAESIRRTIVGSINELFENGVYTAEMENQNIPVPSALPIDRRKLLTHQDKHSMREETSPDDDIVSADE
jgi:hypothetical protein